MINKETNKAIRKFALQSGSTVKEVYNTPQLIDQAISQYGKKGNMTIFLDGKGRRKLCK